MNTSQLFWVVLATVLGGLIVAYLTYKWGWEGGSGGSAVSPSPETPVQVSPSRPAALKPTGGWIPGRVIGKVQYN